MRINQHYFKSINRPQVNGITSYKPIWPNEKTLDSLNERINYDTQITDSYLFLLPSSQIMGVAHLSLVTALRDKEPYENIPRTEIYFCGDISRTHMTRTSVTLPYGELEELIVPITNADHFRRIQINARRTISRRRIFYDYHKENIYEILNNL